MDGKILSIAPGGMPALALRQFGYLAQATLRINPTATFNSL